MAAALEALLVEDNDLPGKLGENALICESDTMHKYYKYILNGLKLLI